MLVLSTELYAAEAWGISSHTITAGIASEDLSEPVKVFVSTSLHRQENCMAESRNEVHMNYCMTMVFGQTAYRGARLDILMPTTRGGAPMLISQSYINKRKKPVQEHIMPRFPTQSPRGESRPLEWFFVFRLFTYLPIVKRAYSETF